MKAAEDAPLTTQAEVTVAQGLVADAQTKVNAVADATKKAAFQARINAVQEKIDVATASFDLTADDLLNGNTALGDVKNALTLPTSGINGTTIAWDVTGNSAVAANGSVTRTAYDPTVASPDVVGTIIATITKGSAVVTKEFVVTVKAHTPAATATATLEIPADTINNSPGDDIKGLNLTLVDDAGNPVDATIGDFTITPVPANTNVDIRGNTDDGDEVVILPSTGLIDTTNITAGDIFDVDITLTDAAGNEVLVTLTVTAT
ncbi:immunoglobulin-like domain-containing protein [Brevibacillus porteri]|uniref:immunoglobulin-like domain-containing protein n=1 Tax=Brevibacillus porteri TaxID=2126350 RepID=UPI003D1C67B9